MLRKLTAQSPAAAAGIPRQIPGSFSATSGICRENLFKLQLAVTASNPPAGSVSAALVAQNGHLHRLALVGAHERVQSARVVMGSAPTLRITSKAFSPRGRPRSARHLLDHQPAGHTQVFGHLRVSGSYHGAHIQAAAEQRHVEAARSGASPFGENPHPRVCANTSLPAQSCSQISCSMAWRSASSTFRVSRLPSRPDFQAYLAPRNLLSMRRNCSAPSTACRSTSPLRLTFNPICPPARRDRSA